MLTPEQVAELERMLEAATPGPWRAGRMDSESYDGDGYGPYKNIYADDERGGKHRATGEPLPYTVARGEGEECRSNAALIAALVNHAPALIAAARDAERLREAIEWVRTDAFYKAPEQWAEACMRWVDRLTAALTTTESEVT